MLNISIIKRSVIHIRQWLRILILFGIAAVIIIGILAFFFKTAYAVTYNGEFIGYCDSKSKLQRRINEYMDKGNQENPNIAYVDIISTPKYEFTFLKRNIKTSDEDIYNTVTSTGTVYYNYFSMQLDGEDKYFVSNYSDAEAIVNQLEEKDSDNVDDIKITEKYSIELASFSDIDECVEGLYEEKVPDYSMNYGGKGNSTYIPSLGVNFIEPVQGTITSRFGWRSRDNHKGIDIANSTGTPIMAAASGVVKYAQYNSGGYGNLVVISHGNGVETYYGHNSQLYVSAGETVYQGQVISAMGSTGISTGPHLHWEVRVNGVQQDPQNYMYIGR